MDPDSVTRRPLTVELELVRTDEGLNAGQYRARLLLDGRDIGFRTDWSVSAAEAERHLVERFGDALGGLMHNARH